MSLHPSADCRAGCCGRRCVGESPAQFHNRPRFEITVPVANYVFDVLHAGGEDLTRQPYCLRRHVLASLDLEAPPGVSHPQHFEETDAAVPLDVAREHGLEGVVAKRLDSRYQPGRCTRAWRR